MLSIEKAEMWSDILRAMAHPTRIIILDFLERGEKKFSEINELFDFDKSTISKHLTVLRNSKIIKSKKIGNDMIFSLEVSCILNFFKCADAIIQNNITRQQNCLSQTEGK